jgi:mannose-1-phosphate guanylyltransferase
LAILPPDNIVVQPDNRGTTHGILLPLIHILARDPEATVIVLAADHYVRDEALLANSLRRAVNVANTNRDAICLLGIEPEEPDMELGYILAEQPRSHAPSAVLRFVEKPSQLNDVWALLNQGAMWNSFIFASSAQTLLRSFQSRFRSAVLAIRAAVEYDMRHQNGNATQALYRQLQSADFSRDVLTGQESMLRVLRVPACGWSDLGTPRRVETTLQRLKQERIAACHSHGYTSHLSLDAQYNRLQPSSLLAVR